MATLIKELLKLVWAITICLGLLGLAAYGVAYCFPILVMIGLLMLARLFTAPLL